MTRMGLFLTAVITGTLLLLAFALMAPSQRSLAEYSTANHPFAVSTGARLDSSGTPAPPSISRGDEVPPEKLPKGGIGPNFVLPTPIPGEALVYFVPSDNDATGTVLYLYNTDAAAHIVALRGFNYDGAMVYAQNINIGASSFLRLVSDSVAAAPPPSWATPAPITTNFTDFTYFASLSLPKGVRVEGYVVFNPGTGVIDPRLNQGAIPLRFSTDPASVFLPIVQKNN